MTVPPPTPRTTDVLVKKIVEVEDGFDLSAMIQSANIITTRVCGVSGYEDGYEGSHMELIERWLAAHFYVCFDNQLTMARAGTATVGFQQKIDLGLRNSEYGQRAMLLDTDGNLAKLENTQETARKINIDIGYIGTNCRNRRWIGFIGTGADITVE